MVWCYSIIHYRNPILRRVPQSLPCAEFRAHGNQSICREPKEKHTANKRHTTKSTFAVCLEKKRTAKIKHTANGGSLPCAMTNTRQPGLFAVCLTFGTRQTGGPGEPFAWPLGLPCASTGTRQSKSMPCVFVLCHVPKLWHTTNCFKKNWLSTPNFFC